MKRRIIILGSIALALGLGGMASTLGFTSCNRINTVDINAKVQEAADEAGTAEERETRTLKATEERQERAFEAGDSVPAAYLRTAADTAAFFHLEPFVASTSEGAETAAKDSPAPQLSLGVPQDSLRRVLCLHIDAEGRNFVGEVVVHRSIAQTVLSIFRQLYEAHYPIERMLPTDRYDYDDERSMADNNTSGYCPRRVAGTKSVSRHALGLAIDINPLYNPCVRNGGKDISPAAGKRFADRSKTFTYKLQPGDLCHKLFKQAGFTWGGDWRTMKDYQHFDKRVMP